MVQNDAIVTPVKGKHTPNAPETILMAAAKPDLRYLCRKGGFDDRGATELFMSRLYLNAKGERSYAVAGPIVGAPYAAMLMETLIVWGARRFFFVGWCGAVSHDVAAGDLVIPEVACIDEGTSRHYGQSIDGWVQPSPALLAETVGVLKKRSLVFHCGAVWSTDAIFRETPERVRFYQGKQVLAVEMECSALFSVAKFRKVRAAAVLVVSDEISSLKWRPGFSDERFKQGRKNACETVLELCQIISR